MSDATEMAVIGQGPLFYYDGMIRGLRRARDLAANGLHADPSTTLQDFLIAIDAILAEEDQHWGES